VMKRGASDSTMDQDDKKPRLADPQSKPFPTIDTIQHKPDMILYHANCPDGFGAAFCAWKFLGDKASYSACFHGDAPPDVTGKHVAVFDFCWAKEKLKAVQAQAASFILLDHHVTAMKENQDEPNCYFDMAKSGATLAWDFFFPSQPVPKMILYLEDRDLWKWAMPDSKAFCLAHDVLPQDFTAWDAILTDAAVATHIEQGKVLLQYQKSCIEHIAKKAVKLDWCGKAVYSVNSTNFQSDVGNFLSSKDDCDFAAIWYYDQSKAQWEVSLRSDDDINNVSLIAKKLGGGGHPRAAGFSWKHPTIDSLFQFDFVSS